MNKIEVAVIDDHQDPGGMMMFLAKLTQRGHNIKCMADLLDLLDKSRYPSSQTVERVSKLPHGTIKRFTPITIAIVGASRRFLAQARTNQVGFTYVSASLQYSDYSGGADFVVPYAIMDLDHKQNEVVRANWGKGADSDFPQFTTIGEADLDYFTKRYLNSCEESMSTYKEITEAADNDTAGYAAPQGLRNILIMQGNHQSWDYFIRTRACSRNTQETAYVTMLIWEALLNTSYGEEMFAMAGPDCMYGRCREGGMSCGKPMRKYVKEAEEAGISIPRHLINTYYPLLKEGK